MRTRWLCLALLAIVAALPGTDRVPARAAPAPDTDRQAKLRLDALKKKLPALAAAWVKKHWPSNAECSVRVVRRVAPAEAKCTIMVLAKYEDGKRFPEGDHFVSIFLRYQDGAWTTTRFEGSWAPPDRVRGYVKAVHYLMLSIDESEETRAPGKPGG